MHTLELTPDPAHPLSRQLEIVREAFLIVDSIFGGPKEEKTAKLREEADKARAMFEEEFPEFKDCQYDLNLRKGSREQSMHVYIHLPVNANRPNIAAKNDA